jgi:hypothetical protein
MPSRGRYDRAAIDAILDEGFVCHVAFRASDQTFAIPTAYVRSGDRLFVHGSAASRMMRTLQDGVDLCVTVTLVDGLVLARSAFHHSINYRSVVVLGHAQLVDDPAEKLQALRLFTDHVVPDRWTEVRGPTPQELKATIVLEVGLDECSAKVRTGPPIDDDEDLGRPVWAGVVPLTVTAGQPVPAEGLFPTISPFDGRRLRNRYAGDSKVRERQAMSDQLMHYSNKLAYEIDSWDLNAARQASENIAVVDVRSPEAFRREHIPGAISVPHRTMSSDTTSQIDRNALVVTYCDGVGCNGSTKGAVNMLKLGFRVKELIGGIDWWKRDGHETHIAATPDTSVTCGCA